MTDVPFPSSSGLPQPQPGYAGLGDFLFDVAKERRRQKETAHASQRQDYLAQLQGAAQEHQAKQDELAQQRFRYGAAGDIAKEIGETKLPPEVVEQQMQLRGGAAGIPITRQPNMAPAPTFEMPPQPPQEVAPPPAAAPPAQKQQLLMPSERTALEQGKPISAPPKAASGAEIERLMSSAHPQQMAQWEGAANEYNRAQAEHDQAAQHPLFSLAVGPGKPLTVRLGQAEEGRQQALAQYGQHVGSLLGYNEGAQLARGAFDSIMEAAKATPGVSANDVQKEWQKWVAMYQAAEGRAAHETASTERASIISNRPPKPFTGTTPEERAGKEKRARTDKDFQFALTKEGLDKVTQTYDALDSIGQELESPNPATQRNGLLHMWLAYTQKDNRLSDKDVPLATSSIGGMGADFTAKLKYTFGGGGYDPETIKQALSALDTARKSITDRHQAVAERLTKHFGNPDHYDPAYAAELIGQNIPGYTPPEATAEATVAGPRPVANPLPAPAAAKKPAISKAAALLMGLP